MTGDFIFRMILGHLFGDYLLQGSNTAANKKNNTRNRIIHCLIYTFSIMLFTYQPIILQSFITAFLIFISHYIIDYCDIVDKFFNFTGGPSRYNVEKKCQELNSFKKNYDLKKQNLNICGFIVRVGADNTLHLLVLYLLFKLKFLI